MAKGTSSIVQLILCLTLSLLAAIALIKWAIYMNFRETLSLALPVIPVLFPLFYRFLDKNAGGMGALTSLSGRSSFWKRQFSLRFSEMRSLRMVLIAVMLSLTVKFVMEGLFLYTFYKKSGAPFHTLFGGWENNLIGRFLRGELLAVTGSQTLPLLFVEALILTAVGGLWIGLTSPQNAILEGLFAGTILAFFATLTNLTLLYARVESVTRTAASLFGAGSSQILLLAGPLFQVFLYGCWTLVGQRWRRNPPFRSTAPSRSSRARSR